MKANPKALKITSIPRVNFINVLLKHFLYESKLSSFSLVTFGFVIFGAKILYQKCARKILMKLMQVEQFVWSVNRNVVVIIGNNANRIHGWMMKVKSN